VINDAGAVSPSLPADTMVPPTIGRYRVVAEKGSSTFGTVYFGEDDATGRPVAIRLLPREVSEAVGAADIVRRRARAVVDLSQSHPSLIGVSEYGITADGRLYAVMERAEGRPLAERLAQRPPMDIAAMLRLGIELGGPVEALHNAGLVHGALRPNNFLVHEDGHVTLLDVELVALRDVPALKKRVLERSPAAYAAPEQIDGHAVSEKTDVYAFATLLHQMVAGELPGNAAEGQGAESWFAKRWTLLRGRASVPAAIAKALVEARDPLPQRRPFMQTLLNSLADRTLHGRRHNGWVVVVAGALLVAAVGALVLWKTRLDGTAVPIVRGRPVETGTAPARPAINPVPPPTMAPQPSAPRPPVQQPPAPQPSAAQPPAAQPPAPQPSAAPPSTPAAPPVVQTPPTEASRPRSRAATPPATRPVPSPQAPAAEADEPDPGGLIDYLLNRRE